jgi:hypothetical protein
MRQKNKFEAGNPKSEANLKSQKSKPGVGSGDESDSSQGVWRAGGFEG